MIAEDDARTRIGTDLEYILGVLSRQRWVVLATVALALMLAAGALAQMSPRYTAQALIMIDSREQRLLSVGGDRSEPPNLAAVDSEVAILNSPSIAQRVVRQLNLAQDEEFLRPGLIGRLLSKLGIDALMQAAGLGEEETLPPAKLELQVMDRIAKRVDIDRLGITTVISIEASSTDSEKAARIADAYADAYLAEQVASRMAVVERAQMSLTARVADLAQKLQNAEGTRNEFLARAGPSDDPDTSVELYRLNEDLESNRQLYESYLNRMKEAQQQRSLVIPDGRKVANAIAPLTPSYPPTFPIIFGVTCAAFGIGLGAAWIRDRHVRGFQSSQDLEQATGIPIIATIPYTRKSKTTSEPQDSVVYDPFSPHAEAIRRLRTNLDIFGSADRRDGGGKVVLVTSTQAGEGKSVISVALGRAAALANQKALVIDCDFRRPAIQTLLRPTGSALFDHAAGANPDSVALTPVSRLDPLTNLRALVIEAPNSTPKQAFFRSSEFRRAIEECRRAFDFVILDGPPAGLIADPLLLSTYADVTLFIVEWKRPRQKDVMGVLTDLKRVCRGDLFAVLNGADPKLPAYGSYG